MHVIVLSDEEMTKFGIESRPVYALVKEIDGRIQGPVVIGHDRATLEHEGETFVAYPTLTRGDGHVKDTSGEWRRYHIVGIDANPE